MAPEFRREAPLFSFTIERSDKRRVTRGNFWTRRCPRIRNMSGGSLTMPKGTRSSGRAGRSTRPGERRGEAGRSKAGGRSRRKSKFGGKRPGVTGRKGAAKQRKALRVRNKGQNRVRGRQSGGGGKASSFTARPIGRTLGVALAGTTSTEVPVRQRPPGGERG